MRDDRNRKAYGLRPVPVDRGPCGGCPQPDAEALAAIERAVGRRRRQRAMGWAVAAMVAVTAAVAAAAIAAGPDAGAGYSIRPGDSTTAPGPGG